jgi:hypothetical protein
VKSIDSIKICLFYIKNFSILVLVFLSFTSFAQQNKVIIISNKYEFQKEKNTYNINTMLKAILISNSYQVFFDDEELPVEIAQNKCNALTGVLIDNSNLLVRKIKFQIRDCQNNLLFETAEVKTREKDIQNAYIEIIKMLSPELKKYDTTIIQEKEVVATPEIDERLKISDQSFTLDTLDVHNIEEPKLDLLPDLLIDDIEVLE